MLLEDLVSYELVKCEFVCGLYYEKCICGMVLFSLGGVNVY